MKGNVSRIWKFIKDMTQNRCKKVHPNTVYFTNGDAAKFSMGMVFIAESGEVIGKYRRDIAVSEKYVVECGGEFAGTLMLDGDVCRIIGCTGAVYTAKREAVRDCNGAVLAWYSGDVIGAAAAFLCLR